MSVSGQNNTVGAPGEGSAQRTGIENWLVAAEQNFPLFFLLSDEPSPTISSTRGLDEVAYLDLKVRG